MTPESDPLRSLLQALVDEGRMPSAVWWVERGGVAIGHGAIGTTSVEPAGEPATEGTPYDLASLTKSLVTAPLLVLLEQDGRLSLDEPLGLHLKAFEGTRWASTTLLELATHTAGLPAWRPLYLHASDVEGYLARIAALEPGIRRGRLLYSDLGYIVLGALIERVTGASLHRAWQRIVGTLNLRRTGFSLRPGDFSDAAATERGNGYERRLAGDPPTEYAWRESIPRGEVHDANAHALGGAAGHAGLFGTAGEIVALARLILEPGREPFGDRARARLLEPVAGAAGRTVGMVAAAASEAAAGILPDNAPGHTGFTGTSLWFDPRSRGIYLLLTNRVHPRVQEAGFQDVRRRFHAAAIALGDTPGGTPYNGQHGAGGRKSTEIP